ncbi:MAG: acyl-CoA dehydrogenase family protein [FCB group bacterium]|jgi:alkylation response protein AidB-like acyl-CoA dehydrogenase|nr:acyl-CoA dehydrogenase family protein [FCB group bacterium]
MPTKAHLSEQQMRLAEELLFSGRPLPSFAKALYFGLFDAARVFPYPHPSEAERARGGALRCALVAFMDAHLDPDAIDRQQDIPQTIIDGLGALGIYGSTVPAEYGGGECSYDTFCRLVEEVSRRCGSTALFINVQHSIGLKAIQLFGTEEQKREWLPALTCGEKLAAFALTEPNAGSDAAGVQTRAVYNPERNTYTLNGEKQWITNGGIAHVLTVMAQTEIDGRDKITAFLVRPEMPGFRVTEPALEKVGMRGTKTAKLAFENMEVPAENILGPKGGGLRVALTVLDFGRTTFGASCTGSSKELIERAVRHAKARHQFGRPLASFDMVKHKIATMSALCYAIESATYLTAGLLDRGEEDFMLETTMLKVIASEAQWRILYDTMQIYGGRCFFTDEPFERMMRDARLNMIGEGSNEVLRAFIGAVGLRDVGMHLKDVLGAAKSPFSGIGTLLGFGRNSLSRVLRTPEVPLHSRQLADEGAKLAAAVRRFGLTNQRLLVRHREGIVENQLVLNRVATVAMALYTLTAVLSRLDSALAAANGNAASVQGDVDAGKLYCRMAFDEIDQAFEGMRHNHDDEIRRVSDRITGGSL